MRSLHPTTYTEGNHMTTILHVHEAADRINARGDRPTYNNIRTLLGGGSFSTIAAGLKSWQPKATVEATERAPSSVLENASTFASRLWDESYALAKQRADACLIGLTAELETTNSNLDTVVAASDALSADNERLRQDSARFQASVSKWRAAVTSRDQELAAARAEVEALRRTVDQFAAAMAVAYGAPAEQPIAQPSEPAEQPAG